jgi:hypothetical protein
VVTCAACGARVFVLPASPLDLPGGPDGGPAGPDRAAREGVWKVPLVVGGLSACVLLAGFLVARPYLVRPGPAPQGGEATPLADSRDDPAEAAAGKCRRLLAQGKFRLARRVLDEGLARRRRDPARWGPGEARRINQLQRQADLLARLSVVPVEEVFRHALVASRDPEEWHEELADFRGRGYVFDGVVRRDDRGRPVLVDYVVRVTGLTARLALEDLEVLGDLPLDDGPRLLFGGRLAGCDHEEGGWVVRFEPASGVLFTDAEALEAASTRPLRPGLGAATARQKAWLHDRAAAPAPP